MLLIASCLWLPSASHSENCEIPLIFPQAMYLLYCSGRPISLSRENAVILLYAVSLFLPAVNCVLLNYLQQNYNYLDVFERHFSYDVVLNKEGLYSYVCLFSILVRPVTQPINNPKFFRSISLNIPCSRSHLVTTSPLNVYFEYKHAIVITYFP